MRHSQGVSQGCKNSWSENSEVDQIVGRVWLDISVGEKLDLRMSGKIFSVDFKLRICFVVFGVEVVQWFRSWQMVEQQKTQNF